MSERAAVLDRREFAATGEPASALLELAGETMRARFNRSAFMIRHHLADHPLFSLERLVGLARRLPEEAVKFNGANIPLDTRLYEGPRTGLAPDETIRQIEECGSWMVLKNVEIDPEYRALLDRCLDEVQVHSEAICPQMHQREGFIFISSPLAVTPYHMDPEHNFLLQIRGTKQFNVWDGGDRSVLSEIELEEYFSGIEPQLTFKEEYRPKAIPFELAPGDGLHVPVATPHWLQNGNAVSISFSITFRSVVSERQQIVHRINRQLRRRGVTPVPYAASSLRDAAKYRAYVALRGAKRMLVERMPGRQERRGA
jgi:hypothetical protein